MRVTNNELLKIALAYEPAKRWYAKNKNGDLDKAWEELTNKWLTGWLVSLGYKGFTKDNIQERTFWYLRAAIELATKYISPLYKDKRMLLNWIDGIDEKEMTNKRLSEIQNFIDPLVFSAIQNWRIELLESCLQNCAEYLGTFIKKEDIAIIKNNITWFPLEKE